MALWQGSARQSPRGPLPDAMGSPSEHVLSRWPCAPSRHPRETTRRGTPASTALSASPRCTAWKMPRNLSDDMKEVAFLSQSTVCSSPGEPLVKDTAC